VANVKFLDFYMKNHDGGANSRRMLELVEAADDALFDEQTLDLWLNCPACGENEPVSMQLYSAGEKLTVFADAKMACGAEGRWRRNLEGVYGQNSWTDRE
jgi:hypothetical protein